MKKRIPPCNVEAEQNVLCAILIDDKVLPKLKKRLLPSDFSNTANKIIYETMLTLQSENEAVDMITVANKLICNDFCQEKN